MERLPPPVNPCGGNNGRLDAARARPAPNMGPSRQFCQARSFEYAAEELRREADDSHSSALHDHQHGQPSDHSKGLPIGLRIPQLGAGVSLNQEPRRTAED
eukprot:10301855-Alexandrium_andersonii.AAC.1